jgi:L-threonylcarbamoyladenylate synthase
MPVVTKETLVDRIIAGELAAFPTDTVPALATLPTQAESIYLTKGRSREKPLILMGGNPEDLWPYVRQTDRELPIWQEIASKYWPGGLTLVLPASDLLPTTMNSSGSGTIGLRIPDNAIARSILTATGPLATTSINLSGESALLTREAIEGRFPHLNILAGDWGIPSRGSPSTVVAWQDGKWQVLRPGKVRF